MERWRWALAVLVGSAALVLVACGQAAPPAVSSPPATPPLHSLGLVPAKAFVADRVVLTRHTVRAGTPIAGFLLVTNASTQPVNLTQGCEPDLVVVIGNRLIRPSPAFPTDCRSRPFVLDPGVNRFPLSVVTTRLSCLEPGGRSVAPMPKCDANGPPPLPAGTYHTLLFGSGDLALPEPAPVDVTLT